MTSGCFSLSIRRAAALLVAVTLYGNATATPQVKRAGPTQSTTRASEAAPATERPAAPQTNRRKGAISGRVVDSAGHPLPHVTVSARTVGDSFSTQSRSTETDAEGQFRFDNLPAAAYTLSAFVPGFTSQRSSFSSGAAYHHLGDSVTIAMTKGGVITGRVTKINGDPAVAVPVTASMIRDAQGRPASFARFFAMRHTDDRGIYRMFGLSPGTYIVSVNFGQQSFNPYGTEEAAPTYHPSATRDTAAELVVREGQELSGADIQLRGDRGHSISGSVSGSVSSNPMSGPIMVSLVHVGTHTSEAFTYLDAFGNANRSFELNAVPDGEYDLMAQSGGYGRGEFTTSAPRRITVKGGDLTGLDLQLRPLGSIAGRVIFERKKTDAATGNCSPGALTSAQETVVYPRRAERELTISTPYFRPPMESMLNEEGEFSLSGLEPGRYRLAIAPPGDQWYVRAINTSASGRTARTSARPGQALADTLEIEVRSGQRVRDVAITLAEGAATLRGRMVAAQGETALPSELLVQLVPVEADDAVRYFQTEVKSNGEFEIKNLAPGRYWVIAAPLVNDREAIDLSRPIAWDAPARARLRREAEAANIVVELQPCQIIADHVLRYPVPIGSSPPPSAATVPVTPRPGQ